MKYIITKDGMVYLFTKGDRHDVVAKDLKVTKDVVSAGFVELTDDGGIFCNGESVSLKIKSRGDADAEFIARHLKGYY